MPETAADVLEQFRKGNVHAFETIFRAHQGEVYRWILRIVRDAGAAEELTVETFWRIYRAHARFDPKRGFAPWARRIATHAALDWLRGQKHAEEPAGETIAELPATVAGDPAVNAETRRKIEQAFARLSPKLRVAATLAVIEEEPHREIAEALGISVAAVKVRVFRALRILRKDLEEQGIRP